jgi:hypothetical protein
MTMLQMKPIGAILGTWALAMASALNAQQLIVAAPDKTVRTQEIVQLPLAGVRKHVPDIEHKVAEDAKTHEQLTTQIYSSPEGPEHDLLLIAVQVPADGKLVIGFVDKGFSPQDPQVFGREAPERKDDFAWENKYVTYRVYGPALEATGEITSGIDVWSKRVPNLVIDSFYKHDAEGQRTHNPKLSYHVDDGVGLDSYLVGPSRGCGGTGILSGGKLWVSKNYTHLTMLSSGPVRFAFELTYAPWNANGVEVTETKRIVLDAGTHLNRITSTFTYAGGAALNTAVGLPIREGGAFHSLDGRILSVWSIPQNPTAGHIATGVIANPTQPSSITQLDDQALMVYSVHSGESFTYYAGSGWSKADIPSQQDWDHYLSQVAYELAHPLKLAWQDSRR